MKRQARYTPGPVAVFCLLLFAVTMCMSCAGPSGKASVSGDSRSAEEAAQAFVSGDSPAAAETAEAFAPGDSPAAAETAEAFAPGDSPAEEAAQATFASGDRPSEETVKGRSSGGAALEDCRAEADRIAAEAGLTILCGGDVPLTFADFTARPLKDRDKILRALDVLDRTLALYPPGFFPSVREGFCSSVTICLARDLHTRNDDSYMESASAFTTVEDDTIWLVLNADQEVSRGTLIHELTHVTDYRLLGMQQLHESEWNRLNPEGFSYYNAYLDEDGTDLRISGDREYTSFLEEDPARIWFYDSYSRTFAMEDRARLMEKLLEGQAEAPDRCFSSPHIQTKLRFYFYTLRQAFENSRWPEETSWEAALRDVEEAD